MENILYYNYPAAIALHPVRNIFYGSVYSSSDTVKKSLQIKIYSENLLLNYSLSLAVVLLMWLSANSFFYLPFTPVPFTMQVFTVLFASFSIGPFWSFMSQMQYILLGIAGVPVFSGFKSGLAAMLGPSGGYIIGFAVSSLVSGMIFSFFCNSHKACGNIFRDISRNYPGVSLAVFLTAFTSLLIIYSFGYMHLLGMMCMTAGSSRNICILLLNSFKLGVFPFILFDLLKIMGIIVLQKLPGKTI